MLCKFFYYNFRTDFRRIFYIYYGTNVCHVENFQGG